ncbi:hypothetical protein MSG28_010059, partial [Choristoneura fumiferana]
KMCQKTVKTVEQKPGIDLDRILLEEIGNGKYQLRAVAPCGLAAFLVGMAFFSGLLVLLTPENLGSTLPESMEDANNLGKDQPSLLRSFTTKLFKRRQNLCTALDISTILRTPLNGPDYLKKIRNGAIAQQRELTGSEASKQKDLSEKSFTKVVIKSWAADWMSASSGADSGAGNGAGNGAENDTGFAAKEMNEKNKCLNYTRVGFAAKEMNEKNKCLNYTRVLIGFLEELRSPGCAFPTIIAVTAVVAGTRHPLSIIVQANRHLTQRSILNRDVCSYDVARNDKYGRYLTANKDIESGELIFTDKPFAYGPKPDSPPLCLGCYCPVAESLCARCGWPACGAECAAAPAHAAECAVFARARVNVVTFLLEHCRLGDRFDKELVQQVCGILESASASSNLHQSRPAPPPLLHARAVPDADAARLPVGVQVLLVRLPALRRPHGARLASQHPQMQQLYGRVAGYGIDELPDLLLERKAELARLVLAALDAVAPGDTRMRGESAAWLVRVVVMESAACRRRASDAEQSARWTYSVTAECEPVAVKEEPEGGECGVSEAAVAEGLYAGHEVKDEVVIGPVTVQQQDVAFSMQNAFCRLEGPCSLKPEGGADDTPDCTHTCLGEGPRCNRSPEQQYRLTSCFVRLERLPVGDLHRGKPCSSMQAIPSASALRRSREQGQRHTLNRTEVDPCQLQPAGGAGAAPECTHTRPGEGPRCNMSHDQQFQLRSCSVRLERILIEDLPTCDTCSEYPTYKNIRTVKDIDYVRTPLNFTELTQQNGYKSEEHTVVTEDGYILNLFRITKGAKCKEVIKKTPVFFMPPLLSSADTALEAGVDAGLPYLISDDCFDTWVGNARGTYYGRRHIRLDPDKDKEFWEFSVDEIGTYDIPAMIDYVSNKTGEDKLMFIGFSQGGGSFFVMCSERPAHCQKIKLMIGLAPATRHLKTRSRFFRLLFKHVEDNLDFYDDMRIWEILGRDRATRILSVICSSNVEICRRILDIVDLPHPGSLATSTMKKMLEHFPAGTSTQNMVRFSQSCRSEKFVKFSYGKEKNILKYGRSNPPEFNLTLANIPILIISGKNDGIVDAEDLKWLASKLPDVKELVFVKDPLWNHVDMFLSQHIKKMIFPKIHKYLLQYNEMLGITKGAKCKKVIKKTPVFFMPPLLSSADTALEAGVDAGLPYLISDDCFDTWVGNPRGTYYGRRHIRLDPDRDKEFWEFSVDEIGTYDIPAMVDYVSNKTGED